MANPNFNVINNPDPAEYATAVTPSDSTDLGRVARALYIGGSGNVKLNTPDDQSVTFVGLQAGTILPVRVKRVFSTDTTATSIVALF